MKGLGNGRFDNLVEEFEREGRNRHVVLVTVSTQKKCQGVEFSSFKLLLWNQKREQLFETEKGADQPEM